VSIAQALDNSHTDYQAIINLFCLSVFSLFLYTSEGYGNTSRLQLFGHKDQSTSADWRQVAHTFQKYNVPFTMQYELLWWEAKNSSSSYLQKKTVVEFGTGVFLNAIKWLCSVPRIRLPHCNNIALYVGFAVVMATFLSDYSGREV
jgi:hypothetical protein